MRGVAGHLLAAEPVTSGARRFLLAEVAVMLSTTTAAVKSTLQRARGRLRELDPAHDEILQPTDPQAREMLDQYIKAFQNNDATALSRLLCRDATLEATPFKTWFSGCATCMPFLRTRVMRPPGDWLMLPTSANGQPAAVDYMRDQDGVYQAYGVVVITATSRGISRIVSFYEPDLVAAFGFPANPSGA